mmetsp:Transcript_26957/g.64722  ORF Transcript_26957/g.64722 Transcript_26957/m.64722 type:complete len:250 (-) Transcript_26957:1074-1823(-)
MEKIAHYRRCAIIREGRWSPRGGGGNGEGTTTRGRRPSSLPRARETSRRGSGGGEGGRPSTPRARAITTYANFARSRMMLLPRPLTPPIIRGRRRDRDRDRDRTALIPRAPEISAPDPNGPSGIITTTSGVWTRASRRYPPSRSRSARKIRPIIIIHILLPFRIIPPRRRRRSPRTRPPSSRRRDRDRAPRGDSCGGSNVPTVCVPRVDCHTCRPRPLLRSRNGTRRSMMTIRRRWRTTTAAFLLTLRQ